ncbi:hypothetical protein IJG14_01655 [bacterium]|nr:hypothetical protein [bacterium]
MFTEDLAKYVNANVQVDDIDTVSVNFEADGVKAQEAIIICDKYSFTKGGDFNEKREEA